MTLDLVPVAGGGMGGNIFEVTLQCRLVNTGSVAISAPYLQCSDPNLTLIQGAATGFITPRSGARGRGLYTGRDFLLHTDDTLTIGCIECGLFVPARPGTNPQEIVRHSISFEQFEKVVPFHPWQIQPQEHKPTLFDFTFRFGQQNVSMQEMTWEA